MELFFEHVSTPLGQMTFGEYDGKICLLEFSYKHRNTNEIQNLCKILKCNSIQNATLLIQTAKIQLQEYFRGQREIFELPLMFVGTDFMKNVWSVLLKIPYGETMSYEHQAALCGNTKAVRAVASANGKNRIAIIVPCHRVIGKNGKLTGYGGGIDNKKFLLELENRRTRIFS